MLERCGIYDLGICEVEDENGFYEMRVWEIDGKLYCEDELDEEMLVVR